MVLGLVPFGDGSNPHRPKHYHRALRHPSLQTETTKVSVAFQLEWERVERFSQSGVSLRFSKGGLFISEEGSLRSKAYASIVP